MEHFAVESPWKVAPGHFGTGPENIHVITNFVEPEDIKEVITFAKNNKIWANQSLENTFDENGVCTYDAAYWNDRQCTADILHENAPEIYRIIDKYVDKMMVVAEDIYKCRLQKRPPCIIRWFRGIEQQPHADKQLNDGSPNPFPTYDINSLIYWNDDFEGGELYYPQHEIVIKPQPGLAVIHPGDIHYLHGVKTIISGERFTTPAFYSIEGFN